ncbi:MAG: hypothetical protein KA988_02730 [Longilinea sp.]|nr:hypothetical protein [Longilinea sp.]
MSYDQLITAYPQLIEMQNQATAYPSLAETYLTMPMSELQPPAAPETAEGTASISGILYVPSQELVLTKMQFYLVAAEGDEHNLVPQILVVGGLASRGDIVSETNEKGEFLLANIPPGNYFLVASPPNTVTLAVNSPTDMKPLLIKLEANQRLSLGVVIIPVN